jgi:hypothetical protein
MTTAPDSPPDSPLIVDVLVTTKKKISINWGKGEHRDLLEKAISDWLKKEGDTINEQGEEILDVHEFANKLGIPPQTFYKYICTDNRRILGDGSCGKKWMTTDDILFVGCVLARADRENDGLSSKEAVDMIQELAPDMTRLAAHRQIVLYVLPVNSAALVLKKSAQKVQATTSDRTNINVAQQYRWHCAVDEVYDLMRTKNTGLCKLSGKSFGELMPHFIIGLDELCLMSDCHSDLRVFAASDKKKQEKLLQDSRGSITVVRTGRRRRAYPVRRQSRPKEGVVKTARSIAIAAERGSCQDRARDRGQMRELSRPRARRLSRPKEGVVKTARSTAIVAERGSCQDRALDGDRGRTRELSRPRARRGSRPNEGVVETARSTAIASFVSIKYSAVWNWTRMPRMTSGCRRYHCQLLLRRQELSWGGVRRRLREVEE